MYIHLDATFIILSPQTSDLLAIAGQLLANSRNESS